MRFFSVLKYYNPLRAYIFSQHVIELVKRFKMVDFNVAINPIILGGKLKFDEGERMVETLFKQILCTSPLLS